MHQWDPNRQHLFHQLGFFFFLYFEFKIGLINLGFSFQKQ